MQRKGNWNTLYSGTCDLLLAVKKVHQLRPSVSASYVSVVSRVVNPMVKEVYQLVPKVFASCVSYRHKTKRLNFAPLEQTGK